MATCRGPVVGIVGHEYVVPKHFGELPVTGTPRWYVVALVAVGARPLLLAGDSAPRSSAGWPALRRSPGDVPLGGHE